MSAGMHALPQAGKEAEGRELNRLQAHNVYICKCHTHTHSSYKYAKEKEKGWADGSGTKALAKQAAAGRPQAQTLEPRKMLGRQWDLAVVLALTSCRNKRLLKRAGSLY